MKPVLPTIAAITLATLFAAGTRTSSAGNKKTNLKGQIIAFRSADRTLQMSSFVKNREVFVFLLTNPQTGSSKRIPLKLVYDHFGHSDLTDEVLRKTPMLRLKAHRDLSCDESFGTFVSTAPRITSEQPKGQPIEEITYLGEFQKIKIPSEQILKCYIMQEGDFRIETPAARRVARPSAGDAVRANVVELRCFGCPTLGF